MTANPHPAGKPMSEWDIPTDVNAAIDWNKRRHRLHKLKRALIWAVLITGTVLLSLIAVALIAYFDPFL